MQQACTRPWANALSICGAETQTYHLIINVKFSENGESVANYTTSNSPTVLASTSLLVITECQFISNEGNGKNVHNSQVELAGYIYFGNNSGFQGAAINFDTEFLQHLLLLF